MKRIFLILVLVSLMICSCQKKERNMAMKFTETAKQGIDFGLMSGLPEITGWTNFSIVSFIRVDSAPSESTYSLLYKINPSGAPWEDYAHNMYITDTKRLGFNINWTGVSGQWTTDNNTIKVDGTVQSGGLSYSGSSTANNPIMYIDGVSVNVNEELTPSGTFGFDDGGNLYIGSEDDAGVYSIEGIEYLIAFFDRILTAGEFASIHQQRNIDGYNPKFVVTGNGLQGAEGNLIDWINGYKGTPLTAHPTAVEDNYLHR